MKSRYCYFPSIRFKITLIKSKWSGNCKAISNVLHEGNCLKAFIPQYYLHMHVYVYVGLCTTRRNIRNLCEN